MGCGPNRLDGHINVDRYGEADLRHDLEVVPWPWPDDSVSEVVLKHVLEHLGRDPVVYLEVMKERYRVCEDGATIRVTVPHHRHDFFFTDPTHVRAVTAEVMGLFSQRLNRHWIARGFSHSPLGIYLGIDFELVEANVKPSELWHRLHPQKPVNTEALLVESVLWNNLIEEVYITLRAVKPAGKECR